MVIKILGTVLTGIGGHYLNRRWDKAILFLSLFILYCVFCWVGIRTFLFSTIAATSTSSDGMMQHFRDITATVSIVYLSGVLILWTISIITTIIDGKEKNQVGFFRWTKTGVAGACLTSLLSFILIASTSMGSVSTLRPHHSDNLENAPQKEAFHHTSNNFYEYLYFGGTPSGSRKLPAPPVGKGVLKGQILFENKPSDSVLLHLVLNSKYHAKNITTDAHGYFTVNLPVGDWKINSIQTESWPDKPDGGRFTMYYGGEEKLTGNKYNRHNRFQSNGFGVTVDEKTEKAHVTIVIKKDIELVWPDDSVVGVDATLSDAISWKGYPSATQYFIEIKHLRREGTTTYFDPITSKTLSSQTALPLSSLEHVKTNGKEKHEYAAEIYAFSEDGTLIGEYSDTFQGGTFILTDGHMLVEEELQNFFDFESNQDPDAMQEKMELISLDKRRVDAVEILIDENMIAEAEGLLSLINSDYAAGQKEVLSGYIASLKGNCLESKRMFDSALSINPDVCIPDKYRGNCEEL